jgi:dephospho-CoA kinase
VLLDAPLLFESKLHLLCDCSIAVVCGDEKQQLQRCVLRDGVTLEQARSRLERQALHVHQTLLSVMFNEH